MDGFGKTKIRSSRCRPWFKYFLFMFVAASLFQLRSGVAAEVIQFPEEELASESVLPVFDQKVSVKNRSVLARKRLEIGLIGGLSLLEPFYSPYSFGVTGGYNFTEEHGIELLGLYFTQGLSSNGEGLNPIPNKTPPTNVNLQYAPAPQYLALANYRYSGFYGKISLAKDFVMHLNMYGLAGVGAIAVGDSMNPILSLGIGEKLYFSSDFALRLDFRFMAYQGPDVLSRRLDNVTGIRPASEFGQKMNYVSLLSFGFIYLFPGM